MLPFNSVTSAFTPSIFHPMLSPVLPQEEALHPFQEDCSPDLRIHAASSPRSILPASQMLLQEYPRFNACALRSHLKRDRFSEISPSTSPSACSAAFSARSAAVFAFPAAVLAADALLFALEAAAVAFPASEVANSAASSAAVLLLPPFLPRRFADFAAASAFLLLCLPKPLFRLHSLSPLLVSSVAVSAAGGRRIRPLCRRVILLDSFRCIGLALRFCADFSRSPLSHAFSLPPLWLLIPHSAFPPERSCPRTSLTVYRFPEIFISLLMSAIFSPASHSARSASVLSSLPCSRRINILPAKFPPKRRQLTFRYHLDRDSFFSSAIRIVTGFHFPFSCIPASYVYCFHSHLYFFIWWTRLFLHYLQFYFHTPS